MLTRFTDAHALWIHDLTTIQTVCLLLYRMTVDKCFYHSGVRTDISPALETPKGTG